MNTQRLKHIRTLFAREGYHALVCRTPEHVLMLTGYQPILGNSFCIISLNPKQEPEVRLVIPVDEQDLVPPGTAVEVRTFSEETMDYIGTTLDAAREPLGEILGSAGLSANAIVGIEGGRAPIIPAYTQVGIPG